MSDSSEQVAQRSRELFRQGYCCAESVLQALAENCGIKSGLVPAIATGLCGGMGRTGGICGAVSGGVLGINLVFGRSTPAQSSEENCRVVQAFLKQCQAAFGSIQCEQLIGCRLDTPEGQRFFKENKLRERCEGFTGEAARLAARLIQEQVGTRVGQTHPTPRSG